MNITPREQARLDGVPESQLKYYPDTLDDAEQEAFKTEHQEPARPALKAVPATQEAVIIDDASIYPSAALPLSVARRLLKDCFEHPTGRTLVYWQNTWHLWDGTKWRSAADDLDVKERVWERLEQAQVEDKEGNLLPWMPTTSKVAGLMEPLMILARVPADAVTPRWLSGNQHPHSETIIAMRNGLLNRSTMQLQPHTAEFFNLWSLGFDFNPKATCPVWERFLSQVFAHDPAGALLLQEFAGYLISGRTDMHKALLIVGPRRGGKGTISRTLRSLMGADNCVSPSLGTLGSDFGLADLIGKPLAVVEDARADDDRRNNTTVERLLNIIGEDAVSVNRKNRDYWNGTLPTRFVVISNETPRFLDSSGAITSRFMSVRLKASFEDNPDIHLGEKISRELPGVFLWALGGLERLTRQGHFTRPETMDEMHDLMSDMASPMMQFLEESYEVTGDEDDVLKVSAVFGRFKVWADEQNMRPMNRDTFVQRVQAVNPSISYKNTRVNGRMGRHFFGIKENAWHFSD
ncbi:DNA primase family protein [Corynebacterium pacaense]|uniref:DNA primase family protein n=1 Tax=Corynebacterium pacaense TaxID=1816684 RepID=UPI0009BAAE15|nr:phage/plasmid primase, P4 family [Corynebacterium pacaense]